MTPADRRDLELSVIKSILVDPSTFDDIAELITENDFISADARAVFTEAAKFRANGTDFDMFDLAEKTGLEDFLRDVSLNSFFYSSNGVIAATMIERESYKRRSLALIDNTRDQVLAAKDAEEQESIICAMSEKLDRKRKAEVSFNALTKDAIMRLDARIKGEVEERTKTGFTQIDERIVGFAKSDLVIMAGRPSMGKTTLAINIMENIALAGGHCLVFSLEMSKEQLLDRMLASLSGIEAFKIKTGKGFTEDDWPKLQAGTLKMKQMNPTIIDTPAIDVGHASNIARKINRKQKLDLIVIDYLQLMTCQSQSRLEEISKISRQLKALAKLTETPVLALSQLSRKVEDRANKRPIQSDLRESGQIEQDADIIQFLYRDEHYNSDSPDKGVCEVITSKFRDGETGTDYLASELNKNRFVNMDYRPEPQNPIGGGYSYGS